MDDYCAPAHVEGCVLLQGLARNRRPRAMKVEKPVESLTVTDLTINPVWRFVRHSGGEAVVRPVMRIPVSSTAGKLFGTQVFLANGATVWALLGNVDRAQPRLTQHFLTVSLERDGVWFHLARYFDCDHADRGPGAVARFLDLAVDAVFPLGYDVRRYVEGEPAALCGYVHAEPMERLTVEQLAALAVPPRLNP